VRGRQYAWANARRLQSALAAAGIEYRHSRELAPTTELRHLQYREDARQGVGRRSRVELAPEYRDRYTREILDQVDLGPLIDGLPTDTATALLCVEADARACHRSIIAERLAGHGIEVTHLGPGPPSRSVTGRRGRAAPGCPARRPAAAGGDRTAR
jgi:uncharacterized protein (DUF488 family)